MAKDLERKMEFLAHLFMKIMEIRRNPEKREVKSHKLHVTRKMKENNGK